MLQVFQSPEGQTIRTVEKDGEPWFVASDVCKALDIANPSQAVNGNSRDGGGLDEDERGVCTTYTADGARNVLIVSESGLYALIFKSRKLEAKDFQRWVRKEVLPAIRKTGGYQVQPVLPDFNNPAAAARAWADEVDAKVLALKQVASLEHKVVEAQPKVQAFDAFIDVGRNISMTQAAKLIGVPPKAMIEWMEGQHYIYRDADWKHVPAQAHINAGRLVLKAVERGKGYNQTLVTPKGVAWLNQLLSAE